MSEREGAGAVLADAKAFALGFVQIPRTLALWTRQIAAALRAAAGTPTHDTTEEES